MMQCLRVLFISLFTACVLYKITADALAFNQRQPRWVVDDLGCVTPEDNVGICTKLAQCNYVLDLLQDTDYVTEVDKDILRPYGCGVDEYGRIKVCCPIIREGKPSGDEHFHHRNLKLLPKRCGIVQTSLYMYSGNQSDLFEFGWSSLLKYEKSGDPYLCGGTLINDRYILTSAQCIQNRFKLIGVRLGELDLRKDKDCIKDYYDEVIEICAPPPQDFDVSTEDAIVHPSYDSSTHQHNIALIRLRHKADISTESTVGPICLPITKDEIEKEYTKYTALGWGATEYGLGSSVLLKVVTEKVEISKCQSFYTDLNDYKVSDEYVCTYGLHPNAFCAGDYGGPLMGYYTKNGYFKTIQYGIVSLRPPICHDIAAPTVHTKVSPYIGWILDNIKP